MQRKKVFCKDIYIGVNGLDHGQPEFEDEDILELDDSEQEDEVMAERAMSNAQKDFKGVLFLVGKKSVEKNQEKAKNLAKELGSRFAALSTESLVNDYALVKEIIRGNFKIMEDTSALFLSSNNSITTTIATNLRFQSPATTPSVVFLLKTHSLCQILLPVPVLLEMEYQRTGVNHRYRPIAVIPPSMDLEKLGYNGDQYSQLNLPSSLLPSIDVSFIQEKYAGGKAPSFMKNNNSISSQNQLINDTLKIWVPSNPRGAERLPPAIIEAETDFYLRRLWGQPSEDLTSKPKYLVTFTVGYNQRNNIDANVKKFSENFTIVLFHYDGQTTEWDEFEWSKKAIHVSVRKQTKWWYAKRFLHPDIVAPYDYIFIWDEDLSVEHFNAEEYLKLVRKHGLEISQPGLEPNKGLTWQMTKRRGDREVHKETEEKPGWCSDPHLPPCAAFVEIMAPVFSRDAWRCVWHMIQNDLVHGWGLDFALRKCVQPAHEKIGVVDSQWIIHQSVPSLGNQGESQSGKAPWQGVRERCKKEWTMFQSRLANAEDAYYKAMGAYLFNSTTP
ncbi:hypothetical protein E2542_SST17330 [Spatholobus suberectus]|nr:hypothetical protein E2542_SST17330 [Spatholobus suberectus]